MNKVLRHVCLLSALLLSCPAVAEEIVGRVVGVADGDTLTILVNGREQIKVRLAEIDAPEKSQSFGQRSKQSLSDLCFGKSAVLQKTDTDRYGRTVAKVHCDGVDANAEQIRRGLAWAYRKYLHDQSLLDLENEARIAKRGLWIDSDPVPPWNFRKSKQHRKRGLSASSQLTPLIAVYRGLLGRKGEVASDTNTRLATAISTPGK